MDDLNRSVITLLALINQMICGLILIAMGLQLALTNLRAFLQATG
jgi:hypothetical protein